MADPDNWDDEVADKEGDAHGDSAHSAVEPEGAASADTQPESPETDPPQQDAAGRARRAQRTRRIKLQGPNQLSNQTEQNGPTQQPASQSAPPKQSANQEAAPATSQTPESNQPLQCTPIQIPPQIVTLTDGDSEDVSGAEEPSKVLVGLFCVAGGVLNAAHGLFHLVKGLTLAISRLLMTPVMFGTLVYCSIVYLTVTLLDQVGHVELLNSHDNSLRYLLRGAIWPVLPIFASFLAIHFSSNPKHQQYLYESLIDGALLLVNSLIMTSHATIHCLVWLGPIFIISTLFRLLYWLSLFRMGARWQQIFRTPALLNAVILSVFNLGVCVQGYTGVLFSEDVRDMSTQTPPTETAETTNDGQGWF